MTSSMYAYTAVDAFKVGFSVAFDVSFTIAPNLSINQEISCAKTSYAVRDFYR